ncbi:MAG: glycerophosphoryl diester phosphodiesterase membrane domain-containing protein [Cyanobacteria bacterium P01_B01_bin.77]
MTQTSLNPGEILRDAFSQVGPVFVPLAILALPANILPVLIPNEALSAAFNVTFAILVGPILGGAGMVLVNRMLAGEKAELGAALAMAWQRAGQLILASLLLMVILIPSMALLLVPGIYLSVRLFATQYEVMLERKSPTEALEASWALTKGRWWQIFGPVFVITLVLLVPVIILSMIFANAAFGPLVTGVVGVALTPVLLVALLMVYKVLKGQQIPNTEDSNPLGA